MKHTKHIKPGDLVAVIAISYAGNTNSSYNPRHWQFSDYVNLHKGDVGLVLETGKRVDGILCGGTCEVLFNERRLKFVGQYWHYFEIIKNSKE